jgi:hypothetical protein
VTGLAVAAASSLLGRTGVMLAVAGCLFLIIGVVLAVRDKGSDNTT